MNLLNISLSSHSHPINQHFNTFGDYPEKVDIVFMLPRTKQQFVSKA